MTITIRPIRPGDPFWHRVLQDYRARHALSEEVVLDALLGALASGQARALVALRSGRPVGGVVLSRQAGRGRIHLLHALPEAAGLEAALLRRAEEALRSEEGLTRITATLPLLPDDRLAETFRRAGYRVLARARMERDLAGPLPEPVLPAGYRLSRWAEPFREAAAALIALSHQGEEDLFLHPELAGPTGGQQLVQQVQEGVFGTFAPDCSRLGLQGETLAGLCLAVWHAALPGEGFILDLCVHPAHRRRGVGRALVLATARAFQSVGAETLSLAVTLSNRPALHLYQDLGFVIEQRFGIFYREVAGGA